MHEYNLPQKGCSLAGHQASRCSFPVSRVFRIDWSFVCLVSVASIDKSLPNSKNPRFRAHAVAQTHRFPPDPIVRYPTRLPVFFRWAEIISHTPCGLGVNVISATLEYIDYVGGVLGSAGPRTVNWPCTVSDVS